MTPRPAARRWARRGQREKREGGAGWLCSQGRFCFIPLQVKLTRRFLCVLVLDGIAYSFGVFLGPLQKELGGSTGAVSIGGSMQAIQPPATILSPSTSGVRLWLLLPPGSSPRILPRCSPPLHPWRRPCRPGHLRSQLHHLHRHLRLM